MTLALAPRSHYVVLWYIMHCMLYYGSLALAPRSHRMDSYGPYDRMICPPVQKDDMSARASLVLRRERRNTGHCGLAYLYTPSVPQKV